VAAFSAKTASQLIDHIESHKKEALINLGKTHDNGISDSGAFVGRSNSHDRLDHILATEF
jgi:hypothetical protein